MQNPARRFLLVRLMATGALAGSAGVRAQSRPAQQVDEAGEQAVALGYRHDTAKVDAKKYPAHTTAQRCSNCSFWQGRPEDDWAGCAMFGRKHIANKGWCLAWARQPG